MHTPGGIRDVDGSASSEPALDEGGSDAQCASAGEGLNGGNAVLLESWAILAQDERGGELVEICQALDGNIPIKQSHVGNK